MSRDFSERVQRGSGIIYAIQRQDRLIKFGFTRWMRFRFLRLCCEHGRDLKPLGYAIGTEKQERELHRLLSGHRDHKEWFRPTPLTMRVVAMMAPLPANLGDHLSKGRRKRHGITAPDSLWGMAEAAE